MPEESCPSVEEEVAVEPVNTNSPPHEQVLQEDRSPKGYLHTVIVMLTVFVVSFLVSLYFV